jgi:hypothetical protein
VRHERATRIGHHMTAHLRTEAYEVYRSPVYPPVRDGAAPSYEENLRRIEAAKRKPLEPVRAVRLPQGLPVPRI